MYARIVALSVLLAAGACKSKEGDETATGAKKGKKSRPVKATQAAADADQDVGDLEAIEKRGTLRVLVRRSGAQFLPRAGMPWLEDIENAETFADSLGVEPVFVLVDRYEALIPALIEGRGDLIAAQLTVTDAREDQVAFARSTLGVEEIVVAKKGADGIPEKIEDAEGWTFLVRKSSSYASSLEALAKEHTLKIDYADEHLDTDAIVEKVTTSKDKILTVVDSHLLAAFEQYNPDIARAFALDEKREIAWAVRKSNPKLKEALDRFHIERAMSEKRDPDFTGDLDGIKERGVLRVLTRNNAASYFLYKGDERGFDYEMAKLIAKELDVRLETVVPPSRSDLIPWLLEGKGDVIAAQMTVTDKRKAKVAFSRPYLFTKEVLVKKKGAEGPASKEALDGVTIHVRPSSSYRATLEELKASGVKPKVVDVPGDVETPVLLGRIAAGEIEYTIADEHLLKIEQTYGVEVEAAFDLSDEREIAYAVRPDAKKLQAFLSAFVKKNYRGLTYNVLKKRYFENEHSIARYQDNRVTKTGQISPFDALIKKYAAKYGFDWRLMAAQAYVESRFDPNAKSWVGAKGLFQVMPKTGASMGFKNLENPTIGTHAGIKYMGRMLSRFDPSIAFAERMRFALASYNVGLGHVYDARRLAARQGLDKDVWFGNVEKALLMLSEKKYADRARHGFCRGREPVAYVSHIQSLYDAYVKVAE
ncbi:MAG: transporter substrate-binding domain-containing protein [Deltaproteobacteria bacterium]